MRVTANYHTHTYRCNHADGDVEDYARVAWEQGATILGISDHVPLNGGDRWWDCTRMQLEELESYEQAIETARAAFPQLNILKALECEYFADKHNWFRDEFIERRKYDYLICGTHCLLWKDEWLGVGLISEPEMLDAYRDKIVESIESGLFAFIAHPDMFGAGYSTWDSHADSCAHEICKAAERTGTPLELNGYGWRKKYVSTPQGARAQYPLENFWQIAADYEIEIVCSSDAHKPDDVLSGIADCMKMAKRLGLKLANMEDRLGLVSTPAL